MQSVHTLITTRAVRVKKAGRRMRLALAAPVFRFMFQDYDQ
jgi:hypothetical protein